VAAEDEHRFFRRVAGARGRGADQLKRFGDRRGRRQGALRARRARGGAGFLGHRWPLCEVTFSAVGDGPRRLADRKEAPASPKAPCAIRRSRRGLRDATPTAKPRAAWFFLSGPPSPLSLMMRRCKSRSIDGKAHRRGFSIEVIRITSTVYELLAFRYSYTIAGI